MNAIVVVDQNWGIGREGNLLVHLPGDLKYYKEKTIGKHIIVGRKTLESFPGGGIRGMQRTAASFVIL